MEERGVLYIKNSVPLQKAEELVKDEEYFDISGNCYKYLGNDEFDFIKRSPLISTELLKDIDNETTLRLFWVLAKNMF